VLDATELDEENDTEGVLKPSELAELAELPEEVEIEVSPDGVESLESWDVSIGVEALGS